MNDLEMLLKNHAWDLSGYVTRIALDQAMRTHAGPEAQALWEKYCPWSDTNGGYINWSKMQDRIKQLAIQADLYVDVKGEPWPRNMNGEDIEGAYERFAQLIIEECATVVEQNLFQGIGWNTSRAVRRHFGIGVEE